MSLLVKNHIPNRQILGAMAETQATTGFSTRDTYKLTPQNSICNALSVSVGNFPTEYQRIPLKRSLQAMKRFYNTLGDFDPVQQLLGLTQLSDQAVVVTIVVPR